MLEEALVQGTLEQENPLLATAFGWVQDTLAAEGIDVEPRDFLLLLNSPQVQKILKNLNLDLKPEPGGGVQGKFKFKRGLK